jgi:hypothetical protein
MDENTLLHYSLNMGVASFFVFSSLVSSAPLDCSSISEYTFNDEDIKIQIQENQFTRIIIQKLKVQK